MAELLRAWGDEGDGSLSHREAVSFKAHYNAPFGVLVTMADGPGTEDRIVSPPLSTLLLLR